MNRRSQIARLRTGGLVGASTTPLPGDEHWDDVTLLLDGSDPTDDLSSTNQDASITNNGSVSSVPVTGPTGYGTVNALSFGGDTQYLTTSYYGSHGTTPSSSNFLNQDFTIEGWFNLDASQSNGVSGASNLNPYPALFAFRQSGGTSDLHGVSLYINEYDQTGYYRLSVGDGKTAHPWWILDLNSGVRYDTGWQHMAVTRSGNTYRVFKNGTLIATGTASDTVTVTGEFTLMSGFSNGGDHVLGDVFDFRITEGVARYTAAFTPPTQSFLPFAARPYSGTFGLGDEHWNDVVLLLDGTDPATDLSTQQQTVTETGSSTGFSNETDPFGSTQDVFDFNRAEASGSGYQVSSSPITFGSSPFTIEMWIKLDSASLTSTQLLYSERSAGTTCVTFRVEGQKLTFFKDNSGGGKFSGATTLAADTWYHVALTYDSSTVRLFLDGQRDGSSNQSLTFNPNVAPVLGYDRAFPETTYQLDGQMAQVRVTKGVARYTAAFTPPTARFPTNAPVVGRRGLGQTVGRSGESNTKSATAYDLTGDTADHTISSDYRITKSVTTGDQWSYLKYDISSFSSGYIYAELMLSSANSSYTTFGVGDGTVPTGVYGATTSTAGIRSRQNGELAITTWPLSSTSATLISSAFASFPLVFSILIDCATKDVWMAYSSENGSDRKWVTGASTSTSTFDINQPFVSGFTGLSEIAVQLSQTSNRYADINFGTDGTFGGATSSNESSSWFFDPPAEIVDLYTTTPGTLRTRGYVGAAPAPAAIDPADHFNTVLWTGDGGSPRSVTGVGFQPEFMWLKTRTGANRAWHMYDVLRVDPTAGPQGLLSSQTNIEADPQDDYSSGGVDTIDTDGFTLVKANTGTNDNLNENTKLNVGFCLKAGGAGVSNTDGDITGTVTVSANVAAGFSIVTYTGTGSVATVGHGLADAPELILGKRRTGTTSNWFVGGSILGTTETLYSNLPNKIDTYTGDTIRNEVTSTTFRLGTDTNRNKSNETHVAYCFHSVPGFSKIGSYTGDGGTSHSVSLGFRPAFLMVKRTDAADNWTILDNARDTTNPRQKRIYANNTTVEGTTSGLSVDFDDTGFTLLGNHASINANGGDYIYLAFAESNTLSGPQVGMLTLYDRYVDSLS